MIMYDNIKMILEHLKNELDGVADIGGISLSTGLLDILDDSDGCTKQF